MAASEKNNISLLIKEKAIELGFQLCGIAKARKLTERGPILKAWCEAGMNDNMGYLSRNIEKRLDPQSLVPGAKSLVVTGLSYYTKRKQKDPEAPVLSRYTYGINYHDVIGEKLEKLLAFIKSIKPEAEGKVFVDSAPLLEKGWAKEAGLGWQGKHSILINKNTGSFIFIGIIILCSDLEYDTPFKGEYCGKCRICIDTCPTGAINDNGTIDTRKCIAHLTIENRGPISEEIIPKVGRRVYGCDRCQEVCPWNKDAKPDLTPEFALNEEVANLSLKEWQSLSKEQFERLFSRSSVRRVKYEHFVRNISAVTKPGVS
jgi:epoxyqueuosine reductase